MENERYIRNICIPSIVTQYGVFLHERFMELKGFSHYNSLSLAFQNVMNLNYSSVLLFVYAAKSLSCSVVLHLLYNVLAN